MCFRLGCSSPGLPAYFLLRICKSSSMSPWVSPMELSVCFFHTLTPWNHLIISYLFSFTSTTSIFVPSLQPCIPLRLFVTVNNIVVSLFCFELAVLLFFCPQFKTSTCARYNVRQSDTARNKANFMLSWYRSSKTLNWWSPNIYCVIILLQKGQDIVQKHFIRGGGIIRERKLREASQGEKCKSKSFMVVRTLWLKELKTEQHNCSGFGKSYVLGLRGSRAGQTVRRGEVRTWESCKLCWRFHFVACHCGAAQSVYSNIEVYRWPLDGSSPSPVTSPLR